MLVSLCKHARTESEPVENVIENYLLHWELYRVSLKLLGLIMKLPTTSWSWVFSARNARTLTLIIVTHTHTQQVLHRQNVSLSLIDSNPREISRGEELG